MRKYNSSREEKKRQAKIAQVNANRTEAARIIWKLRKVLVGTTINVREWSEQNGLDWGSCQHELKFQLSDHPIAHRKRPLFKIVEENRETQEMTAKRV